MATSTSELSELVIDAVRARHQAAVEAEIDKLELAVQWVLLHPGEEVDTSVEFGMRDLQIAGDGAPTIDEGAIAEFALAIGVSTDAGRTFLGDAVELAYRLPLIWERVLGGEVAVWKARKVAQATRSLPQDAVAFVDRHLAGVVGRCSFAQIDRTVDAARAEYDPEAAEERRLAAAETRHLDVLLDKVTAEGLVYIDGKVDYADALAFHDLITARAADLDPTLPLDVRRAMALGTLGARDGSAVTREVVIYTHTRPDQTMVDLDQPGTAGASITPGQLKDWCQTAGTKVTVRPVIDLNEELSTEVHDPTEVMKEQVRLRHPVCVFPNCTRPSRACDIDHIVEWPRGPTSTWNLAPLCRTHHRLKTHTRWDYVIAGRVGPRITLDWTDPSGRRHIA